MRGRNLVLLAVLVCLGACSHLAPGPSVQRANGWRYIVKTDAFTGRVACKIWSHDKGVVLSGPLVDFRLDDRLDPFDTWVSLDGAPARRWDSFQSQLARSGFEAGSIIFGHQTHVLTLPAAAVVSTQSVGVRQGLKGPVARFSTAGLGDVVSILPEACRPSPVAAANAG